MYSNVQFCITFACSVFQFVELLHSPQSVNVSLNEVAEFNCTANSDNIVWRTNGVDVNSGQILFIEIAQSIYLSTMKSNALASLDNTNITCTAVKLTPPSSNESEPALLLVQGKHMCMYNYFKVNNEHDVICRSVRISQ